MEEKINRLTGHIRSLLPADQKVRIMNVCGSHEHTIAFSGLRSLLPENLELIPGPGCPVCVCPEGDIVNAIELSKRDDVLIVSYGDMLRVPTGHGSIISEGRNYRMVTSPSEAMMIAMKNPDKKVVFFSIGFETTTAPTAAILEAGVPENFYILSAHRLTPVVMEVLVRDEEIGIDGFIAPGHVSAIIGANAWRVFSEKYNIPTVVAGFDPENVLMGIAELLRQIREKRPVTSNVYRSVVRPEGNTQAQRLIEKFFRVSDARWRGIGVIPDSGLELRDEYAQIDAKRVFDLKDEGEHTTTGCICGRVIMGRAYPSDCKLFRKACSPQDPKGPCMVSMEGACNIWYRSGHGY